MSGIEDLPGLYRKNVNRKLLSLMQGDEVLQKYFATDQKYIRNYRPGLMKPTARNGRSHFLSPFKIVGNAEAGTFLFNMIIVWTSFIVLYLILLFRLPEIISSAFEKVRLRKAE
jgi:hypothetical protein